MEGEKETSPYWQWVKNEEFEPLEANPDQLQESQAIWFVDDDFKMHIEHKRKLFEFFVANFGILSGREREVLTLLSNGISQTDVAKFLHITDQRVSSLVTSARHKLLQKYKSDFNGDSNEDR